jgi:hypothetical protein
VLKQVISLHIFAKKHQNPVTYPAPEDSIPHKKNPGFQAGVQRVTASNLDQKR